MTRTLALACAVKGGKEIAIIGHTDCKVRQTSVLQLTDRFRDLGIKREQLPENLNEFFGLFASERQTSFVASSSSGKARSSARAFQFTFCWWTSKRAKWNGS